MLIAFAKLSGRVLDLRLRDHWFEPRSLEVLQQVPKFLQHTQNDLKSVPDFSWLLIAVVSGIINRIANRDHSQSAHDETLSLLYCNFLTFYQPSTPISVHGQSLVIVGHDVR